MKAEDINDREILDAWLKAQPYGASMVLSIRACLRVLPILLILPRASEARNRELTELPFLRALFTEYVICGGGFDDLRNASLVAQSKSSGASASYRAQSRILSPKSIPPADVAHAIASVNEPAKSIGMAASSVMSRYAQEKEIWRLSYMDFRRLSDNENMFTEPLWYEEPNFTAGWQKDARGPFYQNSDYDFWLNWYADILAGTPPNWSLLHDIALIPNEDWEKGIGHIAGVIAGIEERYHLLQQIAYLQEQLRDVNTLVTANAASPEHRSHNNPPDLINAPVEIRRAFTVITVALGEAKAELETPSPRPSVLRRAGQALLEAVKSILGYCAALGDIAPKGRCESSGVNRHQMGDRNFGSQCVDTITTTAIAG